MQYRLHIDFPLGADQAEAIKRANLIIGLLAQAGSQQQFPDGISYRVGHDEDRQRSNYLKLTDKGHCTTKKTFGAWTGPDGEFCIGD